MKPGGENGQLSLSLELPQSKIPAWFRGRV